MSHKKQRRGKKRRTTGESKNGEQTVVFRVKRPQRSKGELFAVITRILGGNHLEVMCEDEKLRVARIPGKFRRRRWLRPGDLVIVEPWYGLDEDKKCDLLHRYHPNQIRTLRERGLLGAIEQFLEL